MAYNRRYKKTYRRRKSYKGTTKKRYRSSRRVVPGYTRSVGNYNRYNNPRPENKYFDRNVINQVPFPAVGDFHHMSAIARGTGPTNRIGRKILLTSIHVRGNVILDWYNISFSSSDFDRMLQPQNVRVMVIVDTQTNGQQFDIGDLFQATESTAVVNRTYSFNNLANKDRFKTLDDTVINFDPQTTWNSNGTEGALISRSQARFYSFHKKVRIPIQFSDEDAGTGEITNLKSNSVWVLFIPCYADFETGTQSLPIVYFNGSMRVRFMDN